MLFHGLNTLDTTAKFLSIKHYSPEEDQRILNMRNQGCKWNAIMEAIPGSSLSGIQRRYRPFRLPTEQDNALQAPREKRKRRSFPEEENRLIVELRASGLPRKKISEKLGVSHSLVNEQAVHLLQKERWQTLHNQLRNTNAKSTHPRGRSFTAEEDERIIVLRNE